MFLNDPTYPHDGIITLAHCTAPRKMDGRTARAGPHPDPLRVGLRRRAQGRDAQGPGHDQHRPGLRLQALGGPPRRDRRGPVPAHLPLPDRRPLQVRRPDRWPSACRASTG
ncbi:MAG: hypothetical protein MZV64_43570 [Ignavibacteriales bacterium]|nr:hypothetical protein [Ignavibacteriales bacterium]